MSPVSSSSDFLYVSICSALCTLLVSAYALRDKYQLKFYVIFAAMLSLWIYPVICWMYDGLRTPIHNDGGAVTSWVLDLVEVESMTTYLIPVYAISLLFLNDLHGINRLNMVMMTQWLHRMLMISHIGIGSTTLCEALFTRNIHLFPHIIRRLAVGKNLFTVLIIGIGLKCSFEIIAAIALAASGATDSASKLAINTAMAAAAGGIAVACCEKYFGNIWSVPAICNGVLGGLISISASCLVVDISESVGIGLVGGMYDTKRANLVGIKLNVFVKTN